MKNVQHDVTVAEGLPEGKTHTGKSTAMNPVFGGASTVAPNREKKSHEADIQRGEGLALGKTKAGRAHEKAKDSGKFDKATQARAMQLTERSKAGNADPCGGWDCE